MGLIRILVNAAIMAVEIAAVAALAAFGYSYPLAFAALTAAVALGLGLRLEAARLENELPFYFGVMRPRPWFVRLVGLLEASVKAILAGLVALLTFSGTDAGRLWWVALVFGGTVYAGSNVLRALSIGLDARPARWGYFRLAAPLGIVFSSGMALLAMLAIVTPPSVPELARRLIFELPARASVSEASEVLFVVKQKFDEILTSLLTTVVGPEWAKLLAILVSVNMLTGFVAGLYALLIAALVRWAEERNA